MSPARRLGRSVLSSEESYIRELSPSTTLRAFTEQPIPFDTTEEEYKIFACIESLTPAEKDLGARVAKAAQRLKMWCTEIEQWGWSGTFGQPSEEYKEERRKSVEAHIREHVKDGNVEDVSPLEYWGSLLSSEVQSHDVRLDEIAQELVALDFEELKEHVMSMHAHHSGPSSQTPTGVRMMDDFSILVTQTLVSALPYHTQLKLHLKLWKARITILRAVPQYLKDLKTAQMAMKLAWDAIEPPAEKDVSDATLKQWKDAVDTITGVLKQKIGDLGQRVDRMLDLKEETEKLPDEWIDDLESLEGDYGKWMVESRQRIINVEVLRQRTTPPSANAMHSSSNADTSDITALAPSDSAMQSKNPVYEDQGLDFSTETDTNTSRETDSDGDDGTILHNELTDSPPEALSAFSSGIFVGQEADRLSGSTVTSLNEDVGGTMLVRPKTPERSSRRHSIDSATSNISFASSPPIPLDDSPSVRNVASKQSRVPRPPLNSAMAKRRGGQITKDLPVDSTPPWPPSKFSSHLNPDGGDDLERKISDILTTIPAHIRLRSGPETDAPEVKQHRSISRTASRGYLRATRSISGLKSPELTLSPAKQDFDGSSLASGRRSHAGSRADNDIKLYHLTQPGKEKPIKLYIRRVGENGERVMVRVGGGWADLGEYLRSYAEHHGRRTASEGKFEVLGLEVKVPESSTRPGSALSKRDRRASGGSQITTPQKPAPPVATMAEVDESPIVPNITTSPATAEASAPSTASSRHSWSGNEVGLAGPKTKKLDLSEDKLEWIEGMLDQARRVSGGVITGSRPDALAPGAERSGSRSESRLSLKGKPEFGDLGKVGGTKRVFMKGGGFSDH